MVQITFKPDGTSTVNEPISAVEVSETGKTKDESRMEGDLYIREIEFDNGGKARISWNDETKADFAYKGEYVSTSFKSNNDEPETVTLVIEKSDKY
ncbi:TPA: hypothetical protein ACXJF2_003062 [Serratia marcescens]